MIHGPGVVTVEFSFEAEHTGPFAGRAATGARIKLPGCGVYEYDLGKRLITSGRIYFDVGTLLQSITLVNEPKEAVEALQLNERNLSVIINTIPTAAWTTRADGSCDFLNQRWLDYAGMTAEEASGWGWVEAIHPDDRQGLVEYWQSSLAAGEPVEAEGRLRRFDGAYRWFLFRANPLRDQSGKIVKWYGTSIDIEDRKRTEETLRASELSWRQIVDNIPGLVATTGAMGEVEFLNRQTLEYFGRTSEELKDWALINAVHPEDLPRVIAARKKSIEEGSVYDIEHRCRRADGVYRWFQVRGFPVRNDQGAVTAWYLLLTDIEDRKKAEEALQASERNLSLTINHIPTFIAVTRPDGFILSVNQSALDYHGITLQDTQHEDFASRWFHPDDMERLSGVLGESLRHPRPFECEYRALGKDGKYRWFLVRYNPLLDRQGRIERWYVTGSDIQDRKETEEALRKSERQFRLLVETIPALVWRSTAEGDLDYLNRRAVEYLGHTAESLAGGRWLELVHPDHRDATLQRWLQSATTGTPYEDEYQLRRADGQYRWIQSVGEPFLDTEGRIANWYGLVLDIEDRKRAEVEVQKSEAKLRQVIDAIPALAWCNLPDGSNEFLNKGWHEYTGLSAEESHGWGWQQAFHPDDLPPLMERWQKMLTTGKSDEIEARLRRHDGVYRWFLIRAEPFFDESGNILRWYGTSTDIDDRKRAEEALQSSERNLRQVIDTIPTLIHVLGPDGSVLYVNPRVLDYTGLTLEDVQRGDYRARVGHPEDAEESLREGRAQALSSAVPFESEYRVLGKDGQYRWFLARYNPLLDDQGKIDRWYVTATDIDDRKRAEDAQARQAGVRADVSAAFSKPTHLGEILRGCTEAIVRHLDAAFARIWMLSKDERMLELQASAGMYTRLDGSYSRIPVGDLKVGRIAREKQAHLTNDVMNDPRVNDKGWAQSNGMVAFAGYPLVVEDRLIGVVALFARHTLSESILDTLASVADTIAQGIERKRAEEELRRSETILAEALRVSKTGSFITDLLSDEHNWSEELCRIFELNPGTRVTSEAIRALFHPEDLPVYEEAFKRAVAADHDIDITYRIITPAGKVKHLHAVSHLWETSAGRPVYIGAIQDVTESKAAEQALTRARAELAHMARVTTLSALTASISHEVNQPIAAAITSAGACLRWLDRDQPDVQRAREAALRIEDDGKRAAEIISHLKSFYKKDVSPQRETVSVNDLVEEMLVLLRSEAERHSVVMRKELGKDQLYVSADRVQLQQVLMNLMLNGMESMSERGGELQISTRREGEEAIVSVSDTGKGIPAHQMEEIFKAFVTTKAGGTGMGLAISSTIIESHNGRLWAAANPERGVTFHFTLPTQREAQSER
jgi:PAS domain S-box-containing protein